MGYPYEYDSAVEYLQAIGFDVIERDDGLIEVKSGYSDEDQEIWLVMEPENIPNIYEVFQANKTKEEVSDEYIEERIFRDSE